MTTPTTIVELRSTLLQVPWRGPPPAAGILSAPKRDIYVLEIETQGGLVGHELPDAPARWAAHARCLHEGAYSPARHRPRRHRDRGDLAGALQEQLLARPHGRHGVRAERRRHGAVGHSGQAGRPAAVPPVGCGAQRGAGLRVGLFPRPRPRRHDRARQGVHRARSEGDQDAGRAHPAVARGRGRTSRPCAKRWAAASRS